jgi:hypothetical protein
VPEFLQCGCTSSTHLALTVYANVVQVPRHAVLPYVVFSALVLRPVILFAFGRGKSRICGTTNVVPREDAAWLVSEW